MAKTAKPVETRSYELTYLVPSSFTEGEVGKIADAVTKLVTKAGGKVTKHDSWGKKKMAYRIKHGSSYYKEAYYTHFLLELPPLEAQGFERNIYLQTEVIRHLLVIAEPVKAVKASPVVKVVAAE